MVYFVYFLLGIACAWLAFVLYRRFRPAKAPNAPAPARVESAAPEEGETSDKSALHAKLYALHNELGSFYQQAAHPSDLLNNPTFRRGVELLKRDEFSPQELMSYYRGDNAVIAFIALETLAQRTDEAEILEPILESINTVACWTTFFALSALDRRASEPILARVLATVGDHWDDRNLLEFLRDFVEKRSKKEPPPTFGNLLESVPPERVEFLEDLLGNRVRRWRTGNVGTVLEGDFDLISSS